MKPDDLPSRHVRKRTFPPEKHTDIINPWSSNNMGWIMRLYFGFVLGLYIVLSGVLIWLKMVIE